MLSLAEIPAFPAQYPYGTAGGSFDPGQALASQFMPTTTLTGALGPAPVTGPGTLGSLVVYAYAWNGTLPSDSSTTSDLVEVWVIRNGQVLNSGITCSLPVETGSTVSQRCQSSSTFAVQDGDGIIGTLTLNPVDEVATLSFFLELAGDPRLCREGSKGLTIPTVRFSFQVPQSSEWQLGACDFDFGSRQGPFEGPATRKASGFAGGYLLKD